MEHLKLTHEQWLALVRGELNAPWLTPANLDLKYLAEEYTNCIGEADAPRELAADIITVFGNAAWRQDKQDLRIHTSLLKTVRGLCEGFGYDHPLLEVAVKRMGQAAQYYDGIYCELAEHDLLPKGQHPVDLLPVVKGLIEFWKIHQSKGKADCNVQMGEDGHWEIGGVCPECGDAGKNTRRYHDGEDELRIDPCEACGKFFDPEVAADFNDTTGDHVYNTR
jgi:hypothetical protein